jgi:hypothetical protein
MCFHNKIHLDKLYTMLFELYTAILNKTCLLHLKGKGNKYNLNAI